MITRLDEQLVDNIRVAAQVARCIVVVGERQHDRLLLAGPDNQPRLLNLERLCHESIPACATWNYEPVKEEVTLAVSNASDTLGTNLPTKTGERKSISLEKDDSAATDHLMLIADFVYEE